MPTDDQFEVLRDFIDNSPVGLHWQSRDGTIGVDNRALANLLGQDFRDLTG